MTVSLQDKSMKIVQRKRVGIAQLFVSTDDGPVPGLKHKNQVVKIGWYCSMNLKA